MILEGEATIEMQNGKCIGYCHEGSSFGEMAMLGAPPTSKYNVHLVSSCCMLLWLFSMMKRLWCSVLMASFNGFKLLKRPHANITCYGARVDTLPLPGGDLQSATKGLGATTPQGSGTTGGIS